MLRPRTQIEVDLDRVKQNYKATMARLGDYAEAYAVVKSNAYGHGDVVVARALGECGVRRFAVANIDEAIALREALGSEPEVLILGYTPPHFASELRSYGLTQSLISEEYARELATYGKRVRAHFAIDTGMCRIGMDARDPLRCASVISHYAESLDVRGIFTHLSSADGVNDADTEFTELQLSRFCKVAELARKVGITEAHCLNSAGILYHSERTPIDLRRLVRPGIILYGMSPRQGAPLPQGVTEALSWRAAVAMVKRIRKGDSVGYGRAFSAPCDMTIAIISVGYADGYPRALSEGCHVLINGKRAPIIGRICMNQMTANVTSVGAVKPGDEATLIGRSGSEVITADELAELSGTIDYEICARIPREITRIYNEAKIPNREDI